MKLTDSTEIISIIFTNMADGSKEMLHEIKGSRCHFCKEFDYKDYVIRLRLDWKDIRNSEPTLDADIWRKPKKNKKNRLQTGPWHHTEKTFDQYTGRYIYIFKYQDIELRLATRTTVGKNLKASAMIIKSSQEVPK